MTTLTPLSATFGPAARLADSGEFVAALKIRPVVRGQHVFVHYLPSPAQIARLGIIVPKRLLKLAVDRNTIKRIFRESFRHRRCQLKPGSFVIRLQKQPKHSSLHELKSKLREEVDTLLLRLDACADRQIP